MRIWAARHALTLALGLGAAACRAAGDVEIRSDPVSLRFSGERAFALEAELVRQFPRRHSGQPNNRRAVEWLRAHFAGLGLACSVDDWEVVNYSRPVGLRNLACSVPGRSGREIVLVAHHDHSPATIQGADNDGSGVAILMHLAELFAADVAAGGPPAHTLVFLSADAEEYGMLGSRRYVRTHPDRDRLIAAISLDNLGKRWAVGLEMSPRGQFRGYGALWLQRLAQAAARAASMVWVPRMHSPLEQAVDQAVPVSLMDQGPFVAAGVPALGFANVYDPAARDEAWRTYHSPDDVIEYQSPEVLGQSGRVAEALVRELLARQSFPAESGPYLYFGGEDGRVLRGPLLWTLFVALVTVFFAAAGRAARARQARAPDPAEPAGRVAAAEARGVVPLPRRARFRRAISHFLALWLPLVTGVLLLYAMVAVGLMDRYELYPATARDPAIFRPSWPAVAIFLVGLAACFALAARLAARSVGTTLPATGGAAGAAGAADMQRAPADAGWAPFAHMQAIAYLVIGLAGVYLLAINPFSLLFLVPVTAWLLIGRRAGRRGRALDLALFAAGGGVVYVLLYFFGWIILRNGFAIFWYLMMMFAIGMIGFPTALAITAVLAAGLSLVVPPARRRVQAESAGGAGT